MKRREFLCAVGGMGGLAILQIGRQAWAAQNPRGATRRLVVVFLRGGVDGLNVVVPYAERRYYSLRPTIALAQPGKSGGVLDLDGHFGLHPQLAPLLPLWKERSLAFVHACGSPDETRSHFEAQAYMEAGTPGVRTTPDGWLNRTLAALPGPRAPTEAVNFGETMPRILRGHMPVASLSTAGGSVDSARSLSHPLIHSAFDQMYSGTDSLSVAYRQGQNAHARLMSDLERDMTEAAAGAPSPKGFAEDVARFCKLVRKDATIEIGFFGLSGWDTHVREGAEHGQLASHLRQLAQGLAGFRTGLGDEYSRTVIMVMSEFGRTARENGNAGTDHGHGNVIWLLGGPVRGGKVYGDWPGLGEGKLHGDRDLAVTTDFRVVIGAVLGAHLGLSDAALATILPKAPTAKLSILQV